MGKKRGKQGKYIFLYGACLLAFLLSTTGCTAALNFQKEWQGRRQLKSAESYLDQKDFERALDAYARVADAFPDDEPGDIALFQIGVLWAHPENPERDYEKAHEYFQRFMEKFPPGAANEEKKVLAGVVDELVRCGGRAEGQEKTIGELKNQLQEMKKINIRIEAEKRKNFPKE